MNDIDIFNDELLRHGIPPSLLSPAGVAIKNAALASMARARASEASTLVLAALASMPLELPKWAEEGARDNDVKGQPCDTAPATKSKASAIWEADGLAIDELMDTLRASLFPGSSNLHWVAHERQNLRQRLHGFLQRARKAAA